MRKRPEQVLCGQGLALGLCPEILPKGGLAFWPGSASQSDFCPGCWRGQEGRGLPRLLRSPASDTRSSAKGLRSGMIRLAPVTTSSSHQLCWQPSSP